MVLLMAKQGGYLGRKNNDPPGTQVMCLMSGWKTAANITGPYGTKWSVTAGFAQHQCSEKVADWVLG